MQHEIRNVAVIGAGTMGHALAMVHAIGGLHVTLQDIDLKRLQAAPDLIASALDTLISTGTVEKAARQLVLDRIVVEPNLEQSVRNVDLIVEAVVEDRDIKREVYAKINEQAEDNTILASNTSYLDVFPLIPQSRQSYSMVAHWYTPPYIVDLVDIAPGPETHDFVIEKVASLYRGFGKHPVVFDKLIPGYIANRLQAAMNLEAFKLLDEGLVDVEAIDDSLRHGLVLRWSLLGLLMKADYTGLEMTQLSLRNRMYSPPQPTGASTTVDRLVAAGKTGVIAGAGFYDYEGKSAAVLFQERDKRLLELKKTLTDLEAETNVDQESVITGGNNGINQK